MAGLWYYLVDMDQLLKEIKASKVIFLPGRYAYLKASGSVELDNHFLISRDSNEVTVVTEEKNVDTVSHDESVQWFKLVEIKVSKPFIVKGFLAAISKAIADADLNILIVSTFSKDYILVREEDQDLAKGALKDLGFEIQI